MIVSGIFLRRKYISGMEKRPISRRRVIARLAAASVGAMIVAACENKPPIRIEGKGGSKTKPKVKVKVLY